MRSHVETTHGRCLGYATHMTGVWHRSVAGVSQECRKSVARMSQSVARVSQSVARVSQKCRKSVTECRKSVAECHKVSNWCLRVSPARQRVDTVTDTGRAGGCRGRARVSGIHTPTRRGTTITHAVYHGNGRVRVQRRARTARRRFFNNPTSQHGSNGLWPMLCGPLARLVIVRGVVPRAAFAPPAPSVPALRAVFPTSTAGSRPPVPPTEAGADGAMWLSGRPRA